LLLQVYAFAMIAYELFEGRKPFGLVHPIEAARRACMDNIRPKWGPTNRCTPPTCHPPPRRDTSSTPFHCPLACPRRLRMPALRLSLMCKIGEELATRLIYLSML